MNATAISILSWTAEVQRYSQRAIFYTPIAWRAFKKAIAPVIIESIMGISNYYIQCGQGAGQLAMDAAGITHNPLQAAVRSAIAKLTSAEAQATYSRIRHITRETAMDALVVGVCGVVAIAEGAELAQKVYRQAKAAYAWVNAKLNPAGPAPVILPTVELCLSYTGDKEIAALIDGIKSDTAFMAQLDKLDAQALASVQAKADAAVSQATIAQLKSARAKLEFREECDRAELEDISFAVDKVIEFVQAEVAQETPVETADVCQPNGVSGYVPVVGEISNPQPTNMHQENARMVLDQTEGEAQVAKPKRQPRGTSKAKATGGSRRGRAMV